MSGRSRWGKVGFGWALPHWVAAKVTAQADLGSGVCEAVVCAGLSE